MTKEVREAKIMLSSPQVLQYPQLSKELDRVSHLGINDLLFGVYSSLHLGMVLLQFFLHRHQPAPDNQTVTDRLSMGDLRRGRGLGESPSHLH
jgi:hypothetical protein